MQAVCGQCGEAMLAGRVTPTGVERESSVGPAQLSLVVGVPLSWNPIKAFMQTVREEPLEEPFLIQGRVCPRCGRVELFLDAADLAKVSRLAGSAGKE
jgi:hypothetical protein